jgi:hypothetical protein
MLFKPVKASCQWKSKLYPNFVMKKLIGLCDVVRRNVNTPSYNVVQTGEGTVSMEE